MATKTWLAGALVAAALAASCTDAGNSPPATAAASPRIYVFENGTISGLDPALFNFQREELKQLDFVNSAYLIVHPRGTLMFDSGAVPDSHFKGDGSPVVEGVVTADKPVLPQLKAAGYEPRDVTYFALSHYHSDHTGNANEFANATWIVQKAERDYMFGDNPQGIIQPATYDALRNAKTKILDNEDFDVFGDGSVVIMSTPGHTPGHQVLAVKLANRGTVVLAGDLYHYPEERTTGRIPTFEFAPEQSKVSRARIEKFVQDNRAELWIEHDAATHAALPKSPAFVD
ncbi:MAG TPA: N-acyl homoserine lactonase family protein [Gammaproteobacteria bacterium]|nr:N-acyl homoserine lactonase family protein [Gammaproteobacteria bacterium]